MFSRKITTKYRSVLVELLLDILLQFVSLFVHILNVIHFARSSFTKFVGSFKFTI